MDRMAALLSFGLGLLLMLGVEEVSAFEPVFTISAPDTVRPGALYRVVVVVHESPSPVHVVAQLSGAEQGHRYDRDNAPEWRVDSSASSDIESGQAGVLEIKAAKDWKQGDYNLTVTGSGGIDFRRVKEDLQYNEKKFSVFIQTDKAIYQPSQAVKFRVIVVDVNLKPFSDEAINIYVTDGRNNRIKQWKNVKPENGLFEGQLLLSDQPNLDFWKILVQIDDIETSKLFEVQEYVLPAFAVNVDMPPFLTFDNPEFTFKVIAKYTHGNPVKGTARIMVTAGDRCNSNNMVIKSPIDGEIEHRLDIVKDLRMRTWMTNEPVTITAEVTEDLTGREETGAKMAKAFSTKEKLTLLHPTSSETFKPGDNYTIFAKISNQDDSPPQNGGVITVGHSYDTYDQISFENMTKTDYNVPANGVVELTFPTTLESQKLDVAVKHGEQLTWSTVHKGSDRHMPSLTGEYISAKIPGKSFKINDEVPIEITSTFPLQRKIVVEGLAHGEIVFAQVTAGQNTKSQTIPLRLTEAMTPNLRIVVYTMYLGEVLADVVDLPVDGVFKTPVSVEASAKQLQPGEPFQVKVATEPNAFVALLALDQSVLLLRSGNDIDRNKVTNDLKSYENGNRRSNRREASSQYVPPFYRNEHLASTTQDLFQDAGVVFLTNGIVSRAQETSRNCPVYESDFDSAPHFRPLAMTSRPPMGMHMTTTSASFAMKQGDRKTIAPRVRTFFPETWLWINTTADDKGAALFPSTTPDTITSWIISAFAMHPHHGLGISPSTEKLTVVRPFFAALNLPYSVVRGEVASIQVLVFNYLNQSQEVEVSLDNTKQEFEFASFSEGQVTLSKDKKSVKKIQVQSGDTASVLIFISPKKIGSIDIHATAIAPLAGDALVRKLIVKPEGIPQYLSRATLVDLRENKVDFNEDVTIVVPETAVSDSERVEISAIGDIMGTTINNLHQLLRMPYGCGEQNLLNFVPNVVIAEYLNKTNRLTADIKTEAEIFLETGYQRQLTYRRSDRSFSAFGNTDRNGSTWLTAFVIKAFSQAKPFITIDENVLNTTMDWLVKYQQQDGSWREIGEVINKAMQGGSGKGVALTGYVLTAFLQNGIDETHPEYGRNISAAVTYIQQQLPSIESDYDLAIVTYALNLHKPDSELSAAAFDKLKGRAIVADGLVFWNRTGSETNKPSPRPVPFHSKPIGSAAAVEATAYALMSYVIRGNIAEAVPIVGWLVSKQNEFGGFDSTQDTVVGIQALARFAEQTVISPDAKVDVAVTSGPGTDQAATFTVDHDNALVLQKQVLPKTVRDVKINAKGNGVAIVQVTWSYHVNATDKSPAFLVEASPQLKSGTYLQLNVCANFTEKEQSNMAVMEIGLPSGYVADKASLPLASDVTRVKRTELKQGGSVIIVYFDSISKQVCARVKAVRTFKVAKLKRAYVQVYDYYDPAKRGDVFYSLPGSQSLECELCEGPNCTTDCPAALNS